jgi:hypothetical protein
VVEVRPRRIRDAGALGVQAVPRLAGLADMSQRGPTPSPTFRMDVRDVTRR